VDFRVLKPPDLQSVLVLTSVAETVTSLDPEPPYALSHRKDIRAGGSSLLVKSAPSSKLHFEYVFVGNLNDALVIQNAVDSDYNYSGNWQTIENKDKQSVVNLFENEQNHFYEAVLRFNNWRQGCGVALMK
jgi:hypothetical protein